MRSREASDLIVVGGGIVGLWVARLARLRHSGWRITVVDRSLAGHGATQYGAALALPYGHTPLRRRLARRSAALYAALCAEMPGLDVEPLDLVALADGGGVGALADQWLDERALPFRPAAPQKIELGAGRLEVPEGQVALAGGRAWHAWRNTVAGDLAARLRSQGVEVREGTEVTAIDPVEGSDGGFRLAITGDDDLAARRVVQATGPWLASGPGRRQAAARGLRTKKVVAFHLPVPPPAAAPALYFFAHEAFLLPKRQAGCWLFSFRSEEWDVAPEVSALAISAEDRARARAILHLYWPEGAALLSAGRVFCDGYGPAGEPLAFVPGTHPGHVMAGGASGSGFRLAPGLADWALDVLDGRDLPDAGEGA